MADVALSPFRLRYRLVGTEVVDRIGIEPAGRWVDEVFPGFVGSPLEEEARLVAENGVLALYDGPPLLAPDPDIYRVQRITAPLGGTPAKILIGLNHYYSRQRGIGDG